MLMTAPATTMDRAARPGTFLEMVYRNDAGEVSRRRVRVVGWVHGRNGFSYLRGWCFLRGGERTFRADRILEWHVEEAAAEAGATVEPGSAPWRPTWPTRDELPLPAPVSLHAAAPAHVPVSAAASTVCTPVPRRRTRRGGGFLGVVGAGITVFLIRSIALGGSPPAPAPAPRHVPAPAPAPAPRAVVVPAPRPVPRAVPKTAPKTAPKAAEKDTSGAAVRTVAFRVATGIASEKLEALYEKADTDGSGRLAWDELSAFQSRISREYSYLSNEPALRPDQFLQQGGGDCEDWALFTCGLLRYWGWDPWVGSLGPAGGGTGHAVCMVRLAEKPPRFAWWHIDEDGTMGGLPVKEGWYVPVDYEHVGELSNAVEDGWDLRALWRPESIYEERM